MRPMPTTLQPLAPESNSSALADWIEDYVMEKVTSEYPGEVFGAHAERREDYYSVKLLSPRAEYQLRLSDISEEIRKELAMRGVNVAIYPQFRN